MASTLVKSDRRMKRMESKKSHSWWWDSHISPKNSRWLQENLEEMDQNVKRMLKLIEEDADSFAKKAELYFKKRPELVALVEEFYRMYRSLAERYDHVTGELKKNVPSDLQSQGSGVDVGPTTPSPDTSQDSESESDDSSVKNYSTTKINSDHQGLRARILELESELREVMKENLRLKEIPKDSEKCDHESLEDSNEEKDSKTQECITLQELLKSAQEEVSVWKNKVEKEKLEVSRLYDRVERYKSNISERDQEIRVLKETIGNANKALSEENEQLQAGMTRLTKDRAYLEDTLKEMDLRCQSLDDDVKRLKLAKSEMEVVSEAQIEQLKAKISALGAEMSSKDDHLHQLHMQHVELIVRAEEARAKVKELEADVERKQETILKGAEEKREAIRQLCFSIEHYRSGYHELRQAVSVHKRPVVMAR